jgi:hypothetical protein
MFRKDCKESRRQREYAPLLTWTKLTLPQTRAKVLIAAFARALRDPFVHARNASLQALAATADVYSDEDCATKLLPGICPSLIDKEK